MAGKAKIVGSSIFSKSIEPMEAPETPVETPEISNTTVGNTGQLEAASEAPPTAPATENTPAETTPPPTTPATTTNQEENSTDFSFGEPAIEPTTTSAPANQTTPATESKPAFDLDSFLKNTDKKELYKKLGINDFAAELNDYISVGGDPADYLAAKGIDWNKVGDLDLIKNEFEKKYAFLTPEDRAILFNKKYAINDLDDDDTKADKRIAAQTDAHEIRMQRIAEQQKFKIPEKVNVASVIDDPDYKNFKNTKEQREQAQNQFRQFVEAHEATKALNESKRVAVPLGEDGKTFNFNIKDPAAITNALTDGGQTLSKLFTNAKGEPDINKQQLFILFAHDPQKFVKHIFDYGRSQGAKATVESNQNAGRTIGGTPRTNATNSNERDIWKNARSSTLGAA